MTTASAASMGSTGLRTGSRTGRWRSAAQVLALLRRRPGVTRAEMARTLGMSSSTATEVVARLKEHRLLHEDPAPITGRGRPTTTLRPHPSGPLVALVDLRRADWRLGVCAVDGQVDVIGRHPHTGRPPENVLADVAQQVAQLQERSGRRVETLSLAVAGTVREGELVQAATLGWAVDVRAWLASELDALPVLVGNDATLSGLAEARTGAAAGARCALHLLLEVGVGGSVTVDGTPVLGGRGAAGEFGHMPFGDRRHRCPCGAHGCWDLDVDGRALARHLGAPAPQDPRGYAASAYRQVKDGAADERLRAAVKKVATAFGSGAAGLVNALDPDVVTVAGLAPDLLAAAGEDITRALNNGLMEHHRRRPPPLVAARHGDLGPLVGAAAVALDDLLTEDALDSRRQAGPAVGYGTVPRRRQ